MQITLSSRILRLVHEAEKQSVIRVVEVTGAREEIEKNIKA